MFIVYWDLGFRAWGRFVYRDFGWLGFRGFSVSGFGELNGSEVIVLEIVGTESYSPRTELWYS